MEDIERSDFNVRRPLSGKELMAIMKRTEDFTYDVVQGTPPVMSIITFYDTPSKKVIIARMEVFLYFKRDLKTAGDHILRFLRAYAIEIYKTEKFEAEKHQTVFSPAE